MNDQQDVGAVLRPCPTGCAGRNPVTWTKNQCMWGEELSIMPRGGEGWTSTARGRKKCFAMDDEKATFVREK